jgi:hypothetical protein
MNIYPVESGRDMRDFINLPYLLYKKDKVWIPPLRSEMRKEFSPKTNPFLHHCEWQLFLLKDKRKVIGRIAAFIDTLAIDFWNERIGFFGYFECIKNNTASKLLLDTTKNWLNKNKCTSMRGPWSFVPDAWGMVVDGFTPSPVIMAPYNPPYYNEQMTSFGLLKAKDMLCWEISIAKGYHIPDRIMTLTDKVAERYGITVRPMNMKNYEEEIQNIIEMSNATLTNNWGYSPVTDDEVNATANDLKRVIQAKGVLFAEDKNGRLIGFAIVIPDLNFLLKGLKGRLFPFGFIKLLWGIPRLRRYRMFALGVIPEYRNKAVDSLIYRALNESLYTDNLWMEVNYVLEDNWPMINAMTKLEAPVSRRYRVYEMAIS